MGNTRVELLSLAELTPKLFTTIDEADALIMGSPTYMSGSSAGFRTFVEATSSAWADNLRWRNKIAGGFTNSCCMSGDKLNTLVEMALFAAQHGMIWVGMATFGGWNSSKGSSDDVNRLGGWLGAMAQSNTDAGPDQAPPLSDLRTASLLGRRIAEVTHAFVRGRLVAELATGNGTLSATALTETI
ncbi:MAG: flavodoxin family protein [Polyangiaceae bacterium]